MKVELLAVGTELLLGDVVNTNAAWLGGRLAESGVDVARSVVVGDNLGRIRDELLAGLGRAGAVVVTGGIGPTQDDLTREAFAAAAGVALRRDAGLERELRERLGGLRADVPEINFRQADLPEGATSLPNRRGTAPGLLMEISDGVAYALPGVPHEMREMFDRAVLPDLLRRRGDTAVLVSRLLHTAGMWESAVAEALEEQVRRLDVHGGVTIAFLAGGGRTSVRLTAKAATHEDALAAIGPEEAAARAALGPAVYGVDGETLEGTVCALLRARGETVAVAESLTGGLLGAALSGPPGASDVFRGGVIAYATDVKATALDVAEPLLRDAGSVSADVAAAMAAGVRGRLGASYGLSLTGVAGPTEQDGKPVGTVHVGLATAEGATVRSLRLPGDRERVRALATVAGLNLLRLHLVRTGGVGAEAGAERSRA